MSADDFTPASRTRALEREVAELRAIVVAHITSQPTWLTTEQAAEVAGIRRETLIKYARAMAPNITQEGRITYKKDGRISWYLKSSCIDYALRKLSQTALAA